MTSLSKPHGGTLFPRIDTVFRGIGGTPLHQVTSSAFVRPDAAKLFVKLEEYNAGGSIKSRVAAQMVADAEKKGLLTPGSRQTIIEPTGGNTGTGLAIIGAKRGYRVVLVVPSNYASEHRLASLKIYGADVVRTDHKLGNDSHIKYVASFVEANSDCIWLNQFANPANPLTHYETTAPEILTVLPKVDCFVAGIGSGGTITGIGRRLRESNSNVHIVGVQPEGCASLNGFAVPHKIQGLAVGTIPEVFDPDVVDAMESVAYQDVLRYIRMCGQYEGIFLGISAGANLLAASRIANRLPRTSVVVTIAPDGGRNYPDYLSDLMTCTDPLTLRAEE